MTREKQGGLWIKRRVQGLHLRTTGHGRHIPAGCTFVHTARPTRLVFTCTPSHVTPDDLRVLCSLFILRLTDYNPPRHKLPATGFPGPYKFRAVIWRPLFLPTSLIFHRWQVLVILTINTSRHYSLHSPFTSPAYVATTYYHRVGQGRVGDSGARTFFKYDRWKVVWKL